MSEYCYDSQLNAIENQLSAVIDALQDQDVRLIQISASLIELTVFLAEFKKNWGEPSLIEVPLNMTAVDADRAWVKKEREELEQERKELMKANKKINLQT